MVTLAYELGWTEQKTIPRPKLADNLSFEAINNARTITWITGVDSARLWPDFLAKLYSFQETHALKVVPQFP